MKPWLHAVNSAKKWGGVPGDYLAVHEFFDFSKSAFPDMRHRAVLHSATGIYIVAQACGDEHQNITNSDGVVVPVRDVGEQHVLEDMGRIPTLSDYLSDMPMYDWLGGPKRRRRRYDLQGREIVD